MEAFRRECVGGACRLKTLNHLFSLSLYKPPHLQNMVDAGAKTMLKVSFQSIGTIMSGRNNQLV